MYLNRHEYCICGTSQFLTFCKTVCDEDSNCKGYSFRSTEEITNQVDLCYIYTTSPCPISPLTCFKRNTGFVGDLVDRAQYGPPFDSLISSESGCFMKKASK